MAIVSVDSSVLEEVVSRLSSDNRVLSEMKDSLDKDFICMTNAGLFEEQLKKIKENVDSVSSIYSGISSEVSSHLSEYEIEENTISQVAKDYMSYYDYDGTDTSRRVRVDMEDTEDKDVETKEVVLDDEIKTIDSKTLISLINFIDSNKKDDLSVMELLMNSDNHDYLLAIIKNFYNQNGMSNVTVSSATEVVKVLLMQILNTGVEIPADLKTNSLLGYKEYLSSIASKNNTDVYNMLTDTSYKDVVYTYLNSLYNGSTNGISTSYDATFIASFKTMVDSKSNLTNLSVQDLLYNPLYLV